MNRLAGVMLLVAFSAGAVAESGGWEATLSLTSPDATPLPSPVTLVPRQSIQMTATVWMPKDINWYPHYPDWDIPGATVVPLFMISPSIERQHGDFTQRGATQNYLVTPLSTGTLTLTQQSLPAYPGKEDSPVLPLPPVAIEVAWPEGVQDVDTFLPATAVTLTQSLSLMKADGTEEALDAQTPRPLTLMPGELLKRQIVITAKGIQGALIPLPPNDAQASSQETLTTDLTNYDEFLGGTRTLTRFYAPGKTQQVTLNPLTVRWYDTAEKRFRTTAVKGYHFNSQPPAAQAPAVALTIKEKIGQLAWQQWLPAVMALVAIIALAVAFPTLLRLLRKTLTRVKSVVSGSQGYRFLCLCLHLIVGGSSSKRASVSYQRWQLTQAGVTPPPAAVNAWLQATYGDARRASPGRLTLLLALLRQHRTNRTSRRRFRIRAIALPPLSASGDKTPH
ncbi:hypothetical protein ACOV1V_11175 [Leclercia pneumoniae]|uniref:hypothetical protein n=1 Tax=Leclercia pneumoniae TaxID=2815358 RepID=UPI003BF4BCE0